MHVLPNKRNDLTVVVLERVSLYDAPVSAFEVVSGNIPSEIIHHFDFLRCLY